MITQHWRLTLLRWSLGGRNVGLPEETQEHVVLEWRWQRWVRHRMCSWPETARAQWHSDGPNLSVPLSENHHSGFTSTLQQPGNSETPAKANSLQVFIILPGQAATFLFILFIHFLPHFIAIITYIHHFSAAFLPSFCYKKKSHEIFPLKSGKQQTNNLGWELKYCYIICFRKESMLLLTRVSP